MADTISIARCGSYEYGAVLSAVVAALEPLGGMPAFVSPGNTVLIKPNLVMPKDPAAAATTHPALVRAVAELVTRAGGLPVIADSPGGTQNFDKKTLAGVYRQCGMEDCGAPLNDDFGSTDVPFPGGARLKAIHAMSAAVSADKIINLPKLKTHVLTTYSGAVKNMFGIVAGRYKAEYHLRFKNLDDFADALVDTCEALRPALTIMDAVIGMEGDGPSAGKPRTVGLIAASGNPHALDAVMASVIGLSAGAVPTLSRALKRGLTPPLEDIRVVGETLADARVAGYVIPTNLPVRALDILLITTISRRLGASLRPKPRAIVSACKGCAVCAKSCPPGAITMRSGRPVIALKQCIGCYCCHELCPHTAMEIARPWWLKAFLGRR